jgi:hypothetical protein
MEWSARSTPFACRASFPHASAAPILPRFEPERPEMQARDDTLPLMDAITRWQGVAPPNAAARHGLKDVVALVQQLETLRGSLVFEEEPPSFETALLECREPGE